MAEFENLLAKFQVLKLWKNVLVVLTAILMPVVGTVLIVLLEPLPSVPVDWYIYWYIYQQVIQDIWHPFRVKAVLNPPWSYWFLWLLLKVPVYHVGVMRLLIMRSSLQ